MKAKTGDNTSDAVYQNWYSAVYIPSSEGGGGDDPVVDDGTDLASLTIGSLTLTPAFNADTIAYTASTTNATNTITAVAADADAEVAITVNGTAHTSGQAATWETGDNIVRIVVTNGNATKAYTVTVTKTEEG